MDKQSNTNQENKQIPHPFNRDVHPHVSKFALALIVLVGLGATFMAVFLSGQQQDPRSRASEQSVATASATLTDISLISPTGNTDLQPVQNHGNMSEQGNMTGMLYSERFSAQRMYFYIRNSTTGATSHVLLPDPWLPSLQYIWSSPTDLWVMNHAGPIKVWQYKLSGSPMPTSAALVSTQTFGDADSRGGYMTALSSGAIAVAWNQQGDSGPQGMGVAYRSPAGSWSSIYPIQFMPTKSSKQVIVQHPADGSIWLFGNTDAFHTVGAVHMSESPTGLSIDWTDANFISVDKDGDYATDPENPDIEAVPDPSTGTIALAYQSNVRQTFQTSPFVTGSYPVVAHIAANGNKTFTQLPTYVERVSGLGLIARPGEIWLAYRPIDTSNMTFDKLVISLYRGGQWGTPTLIGTFIDPLSLPRIGFGVSRPEFSARMNDGKTHFFTFTPPSSSPVPSPTINPASDTTKPTIAIVSPGNGATVAKGKTITINVNASDNVGVTKVEFYLNNSLTCTDTTTFYTCNWKVPSKPNVTYTLKAIAYDSANNSTPVSITVTAK